MPQADDGNTISHSGEATEPNVIYLAQRCKDRIAKNERELQNAVPGFNLEGGASSDITTLSGELDLLSDYLGVIAGSMAGRVANGKATFAEARITAFLVRCHRKAEWATKRAAKLECKLVKAKRKARRRAKRK